MKNTSYLYELLDDPQKISKLEYKTISRILCEARGRFGKENLLIELNNMEKHIFIIGDIHGNLKSLLRLINLVRSNNPSHVIFLGDIVDRGPFQLECLIIVLILKILKPNIFYILKGNHETLEMNQYYGFYQDFTSRFKNEADFNEILALYGVLPYAALVNEKILCVHGGIPEDVEILNKLKGNKTDNLRKIWKHLSEQLIQITWNDPKEDIKGFIDSFRGPGIKFFGKDVFERFMKQNSLIYLIRSHEMFPEGYKWFFNHKLLSIFSSENYRGIYSKNPASYALINGYKGVIAKLIDFHP
ncbi:MAG: metallophosphoesterase [Candidatus Lokiarchaeota archaeon]|jgi:diadenosine tetraphosphatase ApaH/serine/threonine PP2A family protein phosphatase